MSFGNFTLDAKRRRLSMNGKLVELDPRPFDLLTFLIARREAAVSRDEILAHVWTGRVVDASNVAVQLSALRNVLKQAGSKDQLILTLPGPCYRFVGDVTFADASPALPTISNPLLTEPIAPPTGRVALPLPNSRRSGSVVALGIAALLATLVAGGVVIRSKWSNGLPNPRLSIVVTPFRNLSPDRSQDYLADAITDDLTSDLAHIPASTVIARESAAAVKNEIPQQVGRELHVRYMLSGTLYHEDSTHRITAELIDTTTGAQLWTKQFAVPQNRLSTAREEIVRPIASALHFQLDQLESTRSFRDRPENPDALDLFFRAREKLDWDNSLSGFSDAQHMLESAVAQEPNFADAQAELGWMLLRKITSLDDPDEDHDYGRAKEVISQALISSPQNAVALAARAREFQIDGECAEAKPYAENALSIDGSSLEARSVLATCAMVEVHLEDAASQYERMLQLNPDSPSNKPRYLAMGYIRLVQGRFDDAIDLLNRASGDDVVQDPALGMTSAEQTHLALIAAFELAGQHVKAASAYADFHAKWPERSVWRVRAYLSKSWANTPGVQRELKALRNVGMPEYADEHETGPGGKAQCGNGDFALTPTFLAGGKVYYTADVEERLRSLPKPLVIDLGRGSIVIDGAKWRNPASTTRSASEFAEQILKDVVDSSRTMPVIVMGDGPTGCSAYEAARLVISKGYTDVAWYRGGEESWKSSGHDSQDLRPQ